MNQIPEYVQPDRAIKEGRIIVRYQPVVSMNNGDIIGYEIIQCLEEPEILFSEEQMFIAAGKEDKKLFINIYPYNVHDEMVSKKLTPQYLREYGVLPENIVFEVTENASVENEDLFRAYIECYKKHGYQIAIADFKNGYAGLNRVCVMNPQYLKISRELIHNIHADASKCSMLETIVRFCNGVGIYSIADGIETEEEFRKVMQLGVDYAQGNYIGEAKLRRDNIDGKIKGIIKRQNNSRVNYKYTASVFCNVGKICHRKDTMAINDKAIYVYEYMKKNTDVTEICVIDDDERVCGLLTRQYIAECFGGRYGYNLYERKQIKDIVRNDYLEVDSQMSIEVVAKVALMRPQQQLYDAIVISENGKYLGVVTVKDLLETAITIQVERATDVNPLTHLPGNQMIEEEIESHLASGRKFSIMYMDLDNFKAYNDAYGFENGDLMIKAVAESMQQACADGEFMGHVGGDDFVIIAEHYHMKDVYERVIEAFRIYIKDLYTEDDYKNGEIISKNRKGMIEKFPLASISCALLSNENIQIHGMNDFSTKIAKLKKESKIRTGNSLVEYSEIANDF